MTILCAGCGAIKGHTPERPGVVSHTICDECLRRLYPDQWSQMKAKEREGVR